MHETYNETQGIPVLNMFKPHRKPHRTASFFETATAPQTAPQTFFSNRNWTANPLRAEKVRVPPYNFFGPPSAAIQTAPQTFFQTATAPQTAVCGAVRFKDVQHW